MFDNEAGVWVVGRDGFKNLERRQKLLEGICQGQTQLFSGISITISMPISKLGNHSFLLGQLHSCAFHCHFPAEDEAPGVCTLLFECMI